MLALWLGSGLIASASEAPAEEAPSWAISKKRRRIIVHGRGELSDYSTKYGTEASTEAPAPEPLAKPVAKPAKAVAAPSGYDGPSAKEIATAALLEASRRLSEDLAAQARREEQASIEAASAQMALVEARMQAELAAQAVRRAQDEEALIALLLAM